MSTERTLVKDVGQLSVVASRIEWSHGLAVQLVIKSSGDQSFRAKICCSGSEQPERYRKLQQLCENEILESAISVFKERTSNDGVVESLEKGLEILMPWEKRGQIESV